MSEDKETRQKLLENAKKEFMEKGYMQASLRNICRNAGVTTGALYFFFQDKEDVFASLVEEPLMKLYETMNLHYESEIERRELPEDIGEDLAAAAQSVHYMYQYYDEFMLILTKSQGSRFEHCVEQFVEITEKHHRRLADHMAEKMEVPPVEDYLIHWMSHMMVDMFVHMLTHEPSEQEAQKHLTLIIQYMIDGWKGLFRKN